MQKNQQGICLEHKAPYMKDLPHNTRRDHCEDSKCNNVVHSGLSILDFSHMVTPFNALGSQMLLFTTVHILQNVIITVCCYIALKNLLFTRAAHKETELFLVYCFTYNLIKLVFFKVLPFTLDTQRPTFLPVLERVLRDGAKVPYRIFFYLLYRLKLANF